MPQAPHFLVIDGYTRPAREQLQSGGASVAADLYRDMLIKWSPANTTVDILFPADEGASLPTGAALTQYDGIAWTGCSSCVNDQTCDVRDQIDLARAAFADGVPSFGSCWAAQIAVVAAGGTVQPNPNGREMGIARKIRLTPEGIAHPLYEGKKAVFDAFTSHDDEITHLPPGGVKLSDNPWTLVQSVCVTHQKGVFWGLQYHPEYDLHEMARLTYCRIEKLTKRGFFNSEAAALQFVDLLEALHNDPARKDIAWMLGIDADVMNEDVRQIEVANWINKLVLPTLAKRK